MGGDIDATTAQLLQRQASSSRSNLRQYAFAASIVNRFYTDASLARQQRVAEVTKRRQAKTHEHAADQAYRVEKLQQELAEAERLRALKDARETARMRLKVSHVAAMYIQFIWRKRARIRQAKERRIARAIWTISQCIWRFMRRTRQRREKSARLIQHTWRLHAQWRDQELQRIIIARVLLRWICTRRVKSRRATTLQNWYRRLKWRHRCSAAQRIQIHWRRKILWRALFRFVDEELYRVRVEKQRRCARILQRTLAKHVVYRRLVKTPELAEFPAVMAHSWQGPRLVEPTTRTDSCALEHAHEVTRKLKGRETALRDHVEQLQKQLEMAKASLADEHERVRRHGSVEEYRRIKDDQIHGQRLQEAETGLRHQIRMEIERELETARRLMIRSKRRGSVSEGAGFPFAPELSDARVETC